MLFVKIENYIIGGPASLSPEDVINHGAVVSMSNVPIAQGYILLVRIVLQLSLSSCMLTIMLCTIIVTNSLNSLRLKLLRIMRGSYSIAS